MANQNINKTETNKKVKKRNVFVLSFCGALISAGIISGILMLTGVIGVSSAVVLFTAIPIVAGGVIGVAFNLKHKKANDSAVKSNPKRVNNKEVKSDVNEIKSNVKQQTKQKQHTEEQTKKNLREQFIEVAIKPNTFAIYEKDNRTLVKDMNNKNMIYRIGDSSEKDFRKVIPSLTENELMNYAKYNIAIFDSKVQKTVVEVSQKSFDKDMKKVYEIIKEVRDEMYLNKEPELTL